MYCDNHCLAFFLCILLQAWHETICRMGIQTWSGLLLARKIRIIIFLSLISRLHYYYTLQWATRFPFAVLYCMLDAIMSLHLSIAWLPTQRRNCAILIHTHGTADSVIIPFAWPLRKFPLLFHGVFTYCIILTISNIFPLNTLFLTLLYQHISVYFLNDMNAYKIEIALIFRTNLQIMIYSIIKFVQTFNWYSLPIL